VSVSGLSLCEIRSVERQAGAGEQGARSLAVSEAAIVTGDMIAGNDAILVARKLNAKGQPQCWIG
jgi:hypothetical protein